MERLYQKTRVISRVREYYIPYMKLLTKPSGEKLLMLLLSVLSMQTITSIQHIYKWFLSGVIKVSQNAYYYLLSYTEMPLDKFAAVTIVKALSVIEEKLKKLPVLLLLDDTLQAKFGTKFECYSTIFDHAKRDGSSYLKGHCFVALTICVPVMVGKRVKYLNIPIRFRLKSENENKLSIASEMIRETMKSLSDVHTVILLCDSWYPKGEVLETVESYRNLEFIANVRSDTAMFAIPQATGKRGRPAKRGRKLNIQDDFDFTLVGKYFMSVKTVITNLFKNSVYMTVTSTNLDNRKSYRLFISTVSTDKLYAMFASAEQFQSDEFRRFSGLLPLYIYSLRWNIEVMFYELKTFWSFGEYMIRSKQGIENFINIISVSYACVNLIPLSDSFFSDFSQASSLTTKCFFGEAIRKEIFFSQFASFALNYDFSFHDFDSIDFFNFLSETA